MITIVVIVVLMLVIFAVLLVVCAFMSKIMKQQNHQMDIYSSMNSNNNNNNNSGGNGIVNMGNDIDNWDGVSGQTYVSFRSSSSSHIYNVIYENETASAIIQPPEYVSFENVGSTADAPAPVAQSVGRCGAVGRSRVRDRVLAGL